MTQRVGEGVVATVSESCANIVDKSNIAFSLSLSQCTTRRCLRLPPPPLRVDPELGGHGGEEGGRVLLQGAGRGGAALGSHEAERGEPAVHDGVRCSPHREEPPPFRSVPPQGAPREDRPEGQ